MLPVHLPGIRMQRHGQQTLISSTPVSNEPAFGDQRPPRKACAQLDNANFLQLPNGMIQ